MDNQNELQLNEKIKIVKEKYPEYFEHEIEEKIKSGAIYIIYDKKTFDKYCHDKKYRHTLQDSDFEKIKLNPIIKFSRNELKEKYMGKEKLKEPLDSQVVFIDEIEIIDKHKNHELKFEIKLNIIHNEDGIDDSPVINYYISPYIWRNILLYINTHVALLIESIKNYETLGLLLFYDYKLKISFINNNNSCYLEINDEFNNPIKYRNFKQDLLYRLDRYYLSQNVNESGNNEGLFVEFT